MRMGMWRNSVLILGMTWGTSGCPHIAAVSTPRGASASVYEKVVRIVNKRADEICEVNLWRERGDPAAMQWNILNPRGLLCLQKIGGCQLASGDLRIERLTAQPGEYHVRATNCAGQVVLDKSGIDLKSTHEIVLE